MFLPLFLHPKAINEAQTTMPRFLTQKYHFNVTNVIGLINIEQSQWSYLVLTKKSSQASSSIKF